MHVKKCVCARTKLVINAALTTIRDHNLVEISQQLFDQSTVDLIQWCVTFLDFQPWRNVENYIMTPRTFVMLNAMQSEKLQSSETLLTATP